MIAKVALVAFALAQTPAALPVLTLEQALEQARQHNQDLRIAQARLRQAQLLHRRAWAGYLPTLAANAGYTRNSEGVELELPTGFWVRNIGTPAKNGPAGPGDPSKPYTPANPPGVPANEIVFPSGAKSFEIQKENQLGFQLSLTQPLVVPALWPAIRNAYLAEEVAALNVENARREVLFAVAQVYYGAAGLKEVIAVNEQILESTRGHERDAQARMAAGMAPEIVVVRAQLERVRAEEDVVRARNAYESARLALATLLDRDAAFEVTRPAEPSIPSDLADGEARALHDRPDLRAARGGLDLAERAHEAVWYKYAPNVALNAAYRLANVKGFTDKYEAWAVTFGLSWTLWDGGIREIDLKETDAKVAEAQASLRLLESRAREELQRAVLDLQSVRANRVKAREQLTLARRNQQLVDSNFRAGMATPLELADATTALRNAEIGDVAEALNGQLSALRLLKALGAFGA